MCIVKVLMTDDMNKYITQTIFSVTVNSILILNLLCSSVGTQINTSQEYIFIINQQASHCDLVLEIIYFTYGCSLGELPQKRCNSYYC